MSIYQSNDARAENGYCGGGNTAEGSSMVIASFPDLDKRDDRKKSRQSTSSKQSTSEMRQTTERLWPVLQNHWSALPQKTFWTVVVAAAVLLVGSWLLFSGSETEWTDAESWRPAPPAASAPEAPRWNSDGQSNSAVASRLSRPSARAIKLDEVSPQGALNETPALHVLQKPQLDVPAQEYAKKSTPSGQSKENQQKPADTQQSSHRRLLTASPTTGDNSADIDVCINKQPSEEPSSRNNRLVVGQPKTTDCASLSNVYDWQSLSDVEYYWAVRRRSTDPAGQMLASRTVIEPAAAYKTAAKPVAGQRTLKPAATRFIDNAGVNKR